MPPLFKRIRGPADIPALWIAETLTLDFKGEVPIELEADHRELAKDVAALANATGGVILVGAFEQKGTLGTYKPMPSDQAVKTKDAYERATRDFCSPAPIIDVAIVEKPPEGFLLAVNVFGFPACPIGVRGDKDAYSFPIRVGTHTKWLRPEQLSMLMLPELRRIAIMIDAIPLSEREQVIASGPHLLNQGSWKISFSIEDLDMVGNRLCLGYDTGNGKQALVVPLDDVRCVWKEQSQWRIEIQGSFSLQGSRASYLPRRD